jgi:hypothetical protein
MNVRGDTAERRRSHSRRVDVLVGLAAVTVVVLLLIGTSYSL